MQIYINIEHVYLLCLLFAKNRDGLLLLDTRAKQNLRKRFFGEEWLTEQEENGKNSHRGSLQEIDYAPQRNSSMSWQLFFIAPPKPDRATRSPADPAWGLRSAIAASETRAAHAPPFRDQW